MVFRYSVYRSDVKISFTPCSSRSDISFNCFSILFQGSISFLIAQHAYMQGYYCVDTLFRAIVLKKKVTTVNYMPIELLMKENVDFYRRTQI